MNKIIYIRFLWVETHLMLGVLFIHTLKGVAISPNLQVGDLKNPGKQDRALAQSSLGNQPNNHFSNQNSI
jgi:hypothetical protein